MSRRKSMKRNSGKISREELEKLGYAYLKGADMAGTAKVRSMAEAQAGIVHREFAKLQKKIDVIFTERDPYKTFEELAHDVTVNRRMYVYTLFSETPLWDERTNWMARAVHDMDHVLANVDFSVEGEIAAYQYSTSKNPQLEPLYLSEIALQAASSMILGAFESGAQRLVLPEYDVIKTAREFKRNGGKKAAEYAVWDAASALLVMSPEDLMKRYAAEGVPFESALLLTTSAMLLTE